MGAAAGCSSGGRARPRGAVAQKAAEKEADAFEKYTQVASLRALISSGDVALVKASYLLELNVRGEKLPRRQDLPANAFVDGEMLESLLTELRIVAEHPENAIFASFSGIVVASYAWGCRDHPDEHGEQLRDVLAPAIEWYMSERAKRIQEGDNEAGYFPSWEDRELTLDNIDFGVFLDYLSIYQKPRSDTEDAAFRRALGSMDLLYAHQQTVKWRLTRQMPSAQGRPYGERGWPLFETAACQLISWTSHVLDLGRCDFSAELQYEEKDYFDPESAVLLKKTVKFTGASKSPAELAAQATYEDWSREGVLGALLDQRQPPMVPATFEEQARRVVFTNNADVDVVITLQQQVASMVLSNAEDLTFDAPHWGPEDGRRLAEALRMCTALQRLQIENAPLRLDGLAPILRLLADPSALPRLTTLVLSRVGLAAEAAPLLADGLRARPGLEDLGLHWNPLGDEGLARVLGALPGGLLFLTLSRTGMGDPGLRSLSASLSAAGLPGLKELRINRNVYTTVAPLTESLRQPGAAEELEKLAVNQHVEGFDELRDLADERGFELRGAD